MADNTVPITAGAGTNIRTVTNAAVDGGAHQQIVGLANPDGSFLAYDPDGTLQVSNDPSGLFLDDFSGALASNWATGGTAPVTSNGNVSTTPANTANMTSYARTLGTFILRPGSYLRYSFLVAMNTSLVTNNTRWWGLGQNATTPTAAAPVLNGLVFQLNSATGNLQISMYSNGALAGTYPIAASRPTDGTVHRYEIVYRQSVTYFLIDGVLVQTIVYPVMYVMNNLYAIFGSANTATAASSTPNLTISSVAVADQSRTNHTISDGANPWIQASVKQVATAAPAVGDSALVVQAMQVPALVGTVLGTVATAATLTLAAPGAGLRHYITGIWYERYVSVATTAAASGFVSGGANHGMVFNLPSDAQAIGAVNFPVALSFSNPVATTAQNTATTFTAPAVAGTAYRISVQYFIAP